MLTFVGDCRLQERIWVSKFLVDVGKRIHNRHINAQITTMVERTKQNSEIIRSIAFAWYKPRDRVVYTPWSVFITLDLFFFSKMKSTSRPNQHQSLLFFAIVLLAHTATAGRELKRQENIRLYPVYINGYNMRDMHGTDRLPVYTFSFHRSSFLVFSTVDCYIIINNLLLLLLLQSSSSSYQ
jgi:hypothetical protein